jgi:DNA invertase Pin-like site-specific DNA recombinase
MPNDSTKPPKPYAALLRVSGKRQAREETIEVQRQGIRLWCERNKIDPDSDVYWFEDVAVSGDVPFRERPGGGQLLEYAETGRITRGVVVYKVNRVVREDLPGYLELEFACSDNGLTLYASEDVIDTSTPFGRTMARMRAVLADDEKRELVRRLADAKRARARMGRWQTRAPYGWQIGDDKRLHLHPVHSQVIREIVRLLLDERMSVYAIADALSRQGIPSPRGLERWDYSTILRMLRNPLMYGQGRYNTTESIRRKGRKLRQTPRPAEEHITIEAEPLVDRATFERIRDAVRANARSHTGEVAEHFWLGGLVFCSECGRSYTPQSNRGKGATWHYYRHAHRGQGACPRAGQQFPRDTLEEAVWRDLQAAATDPEQWKQREAREPVDATRINATAEAVVMAESKLKELEESYFIRGTTSAERYDQIAPRLSAQLSLARRALAAAQDEQRRDAEREAAIDRTAITLAKVRRVIEEAGRRGDVRAKREIARAIVRRVVILDHGRDPGSRYGTPRVAYRLELKG